MHLHFFLLIRRPSFPKISLILTRSSAPGRAYCRDCSQQLCVRAAPRVSGRPECQPLTRPTICSGDPHFHARARSGAPHFHIRARSGAQFFTLPRHIPTKIWAEFPPPLPPGGSNIRFNQNFSRNFCFTPFGICHCNI